MTVRVVVTARDVMTKYVKSHDCKNINKYESINNCKRSNVCKSSNDCMNGNDCKRLNDRNSFH